MVVANELLTRKDEVIVVTEGGNFVVQRDKTQPGDDVESPLIELIVDMHSSFIDSVWLFESKIVLVNQNNWSDVSVSFDIQIHSSLLLTSNTYLCVTL